MCVRLKTLDRLKVEGLLLPVPENSITVFTTKEGISIVDDMLKDLGKEVVVIDQHPITGNMLYLSPSGTSRIVPKSFIKTSTWEIKYASKT